MSRYLNLQNPCKSSLHSQLISPHPLSMLLPRGQQHSTTPHLLLPHPFRSITLYPSLSSSPHPESFNHRPPLTASLEHTSQLLRLLPHPTFATSTRLPYPKQRPQAPQLLTRPLPTSLPAVPALWRAVARPSSAKTIRAETGAPTSGRPGAEGRAWAGRRV